MTSPMLSDLAIAGLQAVDEASMPHEAVRGTKVTTPGPGASRVVIWTYTAEPVAARMNSLSADAPERAQAPASAQLYSLSLPAGTAITAGDRWQVSGETSDEEWTREVSVQREVFPEAVELHREAIVIDVRSNPV
jgi:hypothetical protein